MLDTASSHPCCMDADLHQALSQAQESLDAAAASVQIDADAALDDILAARLLVATILTQLDGQRSR